MTNPDDPRTPQERAYDPAEQSSDETVQWARPADEQTRRIDMPDQPTRQYTTDPYQAYGSPPNPTQAYPTYDPRFDPQAPQPGATQSYPTYYGDGGYPPAGPPPSGEPPAPERGRRVGLWAAIGAGVVLLGLGVLVGVLLNSSDSDDAPAAAPSPGTSVPAVPPRVNPPPPTAEEQDPSLLEDLPGFGDLIGRAGTAMGTVTANDGQTLTLDAIGGTVLTVRTTPDTTLISLTARSVADLKPGESVLVQGDKVEDGTVTAKMIIGTALPEFGN